MRSTLIIVMGFIFFIPSFAEAQLSDKTIFHETMLAEDTPKKSKSPLGAMVRSAILPGWGQVYNNKYLKALVYLGGESYFALRYISLDDKIEKMIDEGKEESLIEEKENERNGWAWLFSAGYLLALGDAYVDAHLYGLYSDKKLSFGFKPDERSRTLQMQLELTF